MQRIAPPVGEHNPNGHTETEVLRALRGLDGHRRLTFRYELLDSGNVFVRDLDSTEVEACTVSQNWLAEVKRTASFRIRVGPDPIDWLSDRIKPWVRMWLPPFDSDDFVEWPQGVFLLVSPDREVDAAGTVWRDVEGYDQLQVLLDDRSPDRFSTGDILTAEDGFLRAESGTWGTADSGQEWTDTTVADTTLAVTTSGSGYASVTLDANPEIIRGQTLPDRYRDLEVHGRIAVDQTAVGDSLLPSVLLRYDGSNYYRVRLIFTTGGEVWIAVTNGTTQIGAAEDPGLSYSPGDWFNVRARVVGQTVLGRVWADGADEPTEWTVEREITSSTIDEGLAGYSASGFPANTNTSPELRYDTIEVDANPQDLVTGVVEHVLSEAGITEVTTTPSSESLPTVREWEPGTPKLEIINDLLDSITYESLSFDEDGVAVVRPYTSPQDRPAEYTYADGDESVMLPQVVQERDLHSVPNQWVVASGEPDETPMRVVYTNSDPASPTSTVRRGRTITQFDDEQEATSEPALIEKVARLAFESSQVYEAIEFDTALMPVHSGNDVYRIEFDPLAVAAKYAEHSWQMPLDASATMRHRARRVISLTAASDPTIETGNVTVSGALAAGNIAFGSQFVTPVASTPTSYQITGLDLQGTGPVRVQLTPHSTVPGSAFVETGVRYPTPTGFVIWIYRTNTTSTEIHWLATRGA